MPGELVLTGDDFGASPEVNEAIEVSHREGLLSSASLISTGPAFEDAAARARRLPELATGLHLVLCDGLAASPPRTIPGLAGADGRFEASPARAGLRYWWHRRELRAQLERELRAQLEAYLGAGLPLDHVDGHHHLHLHPVVFDALVPLLAEYRIPWVRLLHEDGLARRGAVRPDDLVPAIFLALSRRARRSAAAAGTRGAERVYGLRATGRLDEAELARLIRGLRAPTVEIYLHPSRADAAGRAEEAALCSASVRQALKESGYRLSSTRRLGRDGAES
jgi:hopanoid biosynthesis associated protein HpnK